MENWDMVFDQVIAELEVMDPEILAGGIVFYAGLLAAIAAITVIRYLMIAIGYSRMYRKAGVSGWKAFIPVYHTYNNYKISWNGKVFFLYLAMNILTSVLGGSEQLLLSLIGAAAGITLIVVAVKQNVKMAKIFGKGTGTGILLILFPGITSLVLGFGKAAFLGASEQAAIAE